MAIHDMDLANQAGAAFRTDLNAALLALVTNSLNATAPTTTFPLQLWGDTTNNLLKQRNIANTAWTTVGALDVAYWGLLKLDQASTMTAVLSLSAATLRTAKGAAVASGATTNIWQADGNLLHVTGTATITSLGTAGQAGEWRVLVCDAACTFTHGANLVMPGALDVTVAAGDVLMVVADTTTQHRVLSITTLGGIIKAATAFYLGSYNLTAAEYALTDAGTIAWNLQSGLFARVTLGGNRTLGDPTNKRTGTWLLRVVQDGTGNRTLAYHANYKFPGGTDPVLSTAAGAVDLLSFYCDGSFMYGGIGKAYA